MAEYIDIVQHQLEHPLPHNDCADIHVHFTALKCYMVVKDLQDRKIRGRYLNLLLFLVTIIWILPNIQRYSIWNAVCEFGVIFSYSYVQTLYNLHERIVFVVYDLVSFAGSVMSFEIRTVVDIYLGISVLYNYLFVTAISGYKLTLTLIGAHTIGFFSGLWFQYVRNIGDLIMFFIEETGIQFSPRVFFYSLITIPITLQVAALKILS